MVEIRTERLLLRAHRREDADGVVRLNADPRVQEFLGEPAFDRSEALAWIEDVKASYPVGGDRGFWAIQWDGDYIGWFHLRPAPDTKETELGYRLHPDAWGQGFATEGSRALLALAPGRVIARTMIVNVRSRRVMEKLGMEVVRTFPYSGEGPDDEVEYAVESKNRPESCARDVS